MSKKAEEGDRVVLADGMSEKGKEVGTDGVYIGRCIL